MSEVFEAATASETRTARSMPPAGEQGAPVSLAGWELMRLIGQGNWTEVFQARPAGASPAAAAPYAVKRLRAGCEIDPHAIAALRREAVLGLSVAHPRLLSVLAAHVHEPPFYLVMPYLAGGTLMQHLAREGRVPVAVALWRARQLAEALDALHRAGWLHGDVKPENVIISPQGHATLVDLGLARRITGEGLSGEPVGGTLHYLAPEMVTVGMAVDARADLYSLGVVLFEMLTGRLPLQAAGRREFTAKLRTQTPPDLRKLAPGIPAAVRDLAASLLAKQPLRRPQSAREVVDQLVRLEIETLADRFASAAS